MPRPAVVQQYYSCSLATVKLSGQQRKLDWLVQYLLVQRGGVWRLQEVRRSAGQSVGLSVLIRLTSRWTNRRMIGWHRGGFYFDSLVLQDAWGRGGGAKERHKKLKVYILKTPLTNCDQTMRAKNRTHRTVKQVYLKIQQINTALASCSI